MPDPSTSTTAMPVVIDSDTVSSFTFGGPHGSVPVVVNGVNVNTAIGSLQTSVTELLLGGIEEDQKLTALRRRVTDLEQNPFPPFTIPLVSVADTTTGHVQMAMLSFDPSLYAVAGKTTVLTLVITGFTTADPSAGDFVTGMFYLLPYGSSTVISPTVMFDQSTYLVPSTALGDVYIPSTTNPTIYELRGFHTGTGGAIHFGASLRISWRS
jgi:hypothetical protein